MLIKFYKPISLLGCVAMLLLSGNLQPSMALGVEDATAQQSRQISLSGKVVDQTGEPVIGATVIVKGTTRGVSTDIDGVYSKLMVSVGETIECKFMGYAPAEYKVVEGVATHNFTLSENTVAIDQVVVTALGIKRQSKALGYAMQEVAGDKLLETRQVNVTNALTGQVPGLQVSKGGGPTGSSKIILRGQNSLTGSNQPLIVVDGVPIDNFTGGNLDSYGNKGADMGNGLADLNPEDIESMTVLKGGSAAALYGSRAGNGVILVTTKSGRSQSGIGITVSASLGFENILIMPELQNSFSQGDNGLYDNLSRYSWGTRMDGTAKGKNWKGDEVVLQAYDNIGSFFRTGVIDTESITFQQQVNRTSVYASITRMNDVSMIPGTELSRTSVTARATTNLGSDDKWKLDFKVNYVNSKAQNRPLQGINQSNSFYTINTLPRSIDLAQFNPSIDAQGNQVWWDTKSTPQDNPWWTAQYNLNNDERNRYISFASLSYQFTDWLRGELKAGIDYYNTTNSNKKHTGGLSSPRGRYSEGADDFMESNLSFLFVAQKDQLFGDFGGSFTFGGNLMDQKRHSMTASSGDLLIPNIFSLNNGVDKPTVSSSQINRKMNSLYGSLQVNWKRALFLDATLRNDWSSTMSINNRSYMYPSVSFSGVISELVNMPSWWTFAKVRASYAEVGNDLAPYQLYNSYSVNKDFWSNPTANSGSILYNPNVVSELVKSWEAGIDVRFFDNRLRVDLSWYKSNATNQLLDLPLDPSSSGYSSKKINAGNIQNTGFELSLGGSILRSQKGLNWETTVNWSTNKNEIIELTPGVSEYSLYSNDDLRVVAVAGGGYGDIYGSTIKKVDDVNSQYYGRWLLDANGAPQLGDIAYLGNQQPDMLIGWNNNFTWKGVSLGIMFDARLGGKMFSLTAAKLHQFGSAAATAPDGLRENMVVNGVVPDGNGGYKENTSGITPQQYYRDILGQRNIGITEPYLYDATSIRLRTLSLGYEFPKKLLAKTPIQRIRASVTANNLWLIYTALPGIDPESVSGTGTNVQAVELGVPPTSRTFTFNLTIGF